MTVMVFPTRVGVIPFCASWNISIASIPHTGGGDPISSTNCRKWQWYSPHGWGWSLVLRRHRHWQTVFPTRVGVILRQALIWTPSASIPHTGGGDPQTSWYMLLPDQYSPHGWGWSCPSKGKLHDYIVFPTRVGVILFGGRRKKRPVSIPHTGGGDPTLKGRVNARPLYSPHGWGWSLIEISGLVLSSHDTPWLQMIFLNLKSLVLCKWNRVKPWIAIHLVEAQS